jgi:WD40 repeat protein
VIEAVPGAAERTSPYRGLVPYSKDDAEFFFGRDTERQLISANLLSSRLTVLYGASGVGKSSVLRAGVVHDLVQRSREDVAATGAPEFVVVEFGSWHDDPIVGLAESIRESVKLVREPPAPPPTTRHLAELLGDWTALLSVDLLIILDQFEEYFLYHDHEEGQGTFAVEFPRAVNRNLGVNFLISIREDALARLDRFKGRIPNLFSNFLRLDHLDRRAAQDAIQMPIAHYNQVRSGDTQFSIQTRLVDAVLEQVKTGRVVLETSGEGVVGDRMVEEGEGTTRDDSRIETPYLQLVMSRLWEEEIRAGSQLLRLETLERLGGAEVLVRTHLDEAMAGLAPEERDLAARVFRQLVTPGRTKIAHTLPDLFYFTRCPEDALGEVLERLTKGDARILRSIPPPPGETGGPRYEIFHDVLAPAILDWRARYEAEARLEREKREMEEQHRLARARARARARRFGIAAAAAAVVAVAGGILAFVAVRQANIAQSRSLVAQAVSSMASDPQHSVRLALRALDTRETDEAALAVLREALTESRIRSIMRGHTDIVWAAALSPNGKRVVTASRDQTARIWDAKTGAEVHRLSGHTDEVTSAAFSPDGKYVVTASLDGTARVWDVETGDELHTLLHDDVVYLAATDRFVQDSGYVATGAFSPTGDRVITASLDGTAKIWDIQTGEELLILENHRIGVSSAAFGPSGDRVVTAGLNGVARIWDAATGHSIHTMDNVTDWSNSAVFSPDERWVAVGNSDTTIGIWNASTGIVHRYLGFDKRPVAPGHTDEVWSVSFSPDSKMVLSTGDKTARVWQVQSGEQVTVMGGASWIDMAEYSPDGSYVLTANQDGTARLFEAATGEELLALRGHTDIMWMAKFGPDGTSVVTASEDGTARLWSANTGTELRGHIRPVVSAAFNPDGSRVITSSVDETARIWDARGGVELATLSGEEKDFGWWPMWSAGWSQNGDRLVTAQESGDVQIWAADTGKVVRSCCDNSGWPAIWAEFSPDAGQVLVVYDDLSGTARLWDVNAGGEGQEIHVFERGRIHLAGFAPGGTFILTSGRDDKRTTVWNASTFEEVEVIRTGLVVSAAFSPGGKRIATAGTDRTVRLWEVSTGRLLHRLPTPSAISALTFSADGNWLVSGGSDGATRVWDANTGQVLAVLHMHSGSVNAVAVSRDGRIVSASEDRTAKVYRCPTCGPDEQLIVRAREHAEIGAA